MKKYLVGVASFFILFCGYADQEPAGQKPIGQKPIGQKPDMAGVGVLVVDYPYKGMDTKASVIPLIWWQEGNFYIRAARAGVVLGDPEYEPCELSIFIEPRLMGYKDGDSDTLGGMQDRSGSLDAGLALQWLMPGTEALFLHASWAADVLNEYNGNEAELSLARTFEHSPFFIKPAAGIQWQSENLVDYYYGVRGSESTARRAAYEGKSALNAFGSLDVYCALSEEWILAARIGATFLADEIQDSPIVDDDVSMFGSFGIMRIF